MAGMIGLAREVGLHPIRCHNCGHSLRTGRLLRALLERFAQELALGGEVYLRDFGWFRTTIRKAGKYAKPIIPGHDSFDAFPVVRFRPSDRLKATVKKGLARRMREQKGSGE